MRKLPWLLLVYGLLLALCCPSVAFAVDGFETRITTNAADQTDPAISGNYIVFTDSRNGNEDIYSYDLVSQVETNLTPGTSTDQYLDDVDGVNVVFTSVAVGGNDIWLLDLSTSLSTPLTSGGNNYAPTVDGHHVVWVEASAYGRKSSARPWPTHFSSPTATSLRPPAPSGSRRTPAGERCTSTVCSRMERVASWSSMKTGLRAVGDCDLRLSPTSGGGGS